MFFLGGLSTLLGAGAGAGAAATAVVPGIAGAATVVPAAASGISLATILQGGATVLGIVSSIAAGNAEGERLDLAAEDADREQPLETLQGISRRRSLKAAAVESLGEMDVAYAGSGVDLSFGTAAQAKTEAYRELDLGLTSDAGTQSTRQARLVERAKNYRSMAKRARIGGILGGLDQGFKFAAGVAGRGG